MSESPRSVSGAGTADIVSVAAGDGVSAGGGGGGFASHPASVASAIARYGSLRIMHRISAGRPDRASAP